LLADGKLSLRPLVTHQFTIQNAAAAYDLITGKTQESYLGVLIEYSNEERQDSRRLELVAFRSRVSAEAQVRVGMLGAGNFARSVLIPAIKQDRRSELVGICASSGASSRSAADKFGFAFCTTDEAAVCSDPSISAVVIATRHHLHAAQVLRALECGKHVFCEKPLCLIEQELDAIRQAYSRNEGECQLMVGFNRRFAPMAQRMKSFLAEADGPFTMHYRVNAGSLPNDHWINDPEQGGGRILGEACHFVDFLAFLCGALPISVHARSVSSLGNNQDVVASVEFDNGSLGTVSYLGSGDRAFSKERIEVFGAGCVAVLDDFRQLELVRHGKKRSFRSWLRQDKGHAAEWRAFSECIQSRQLAPIPFTEIVASTLATIRITDSLRSGQAEVVSLQSLNRLSAPLVS